VQGEVEALRAAEREVRSGARAELLEDLASRRQEIAEMVAQLQAAPALARAVEAQHRIARSRRKKSASPPASRSGR